MKKIIAVLLFAFCYAGAYAQAKIHIEYDNNGNRILRYYTPQKPAPEQDSIKNNELWGNPLAISDSSLNGGLAALSNPGFKVYPNPSNDKFNIAIDAEMLKGACELILTDQLGKVHYKKTVTGAVTTISTRQLADGVYYIILNQGNRKSTVKLVKEVSH